MTNTPRLAALRDSNLTRQYTVLESARVGRNEAPECPMLIGMPRSRLVFARFPALPLRLLPGRRARGHHEAVCGHDITETEGAIRDR